MSEGYKKILKIWFVVYAILAAFRIINIFDNTILKSIFSIGTYSLSITSLILFVFVGNRGEDKLAKYGIITLIVYFLLTVGYKTSIYDLGLSTYVDVGFKNKFFTIMYYACGNIITIFEYMAIFSLIKDNEKTEKYKAISIVALVIFTIIDLKNDIFPKNPSAFINKMALCLQCISTFAKYAAIVFCLTDDKYYSNVFVTPNYYSKEVVYQQPEPVQPQQPISVNQQVYQQPEPVQPQQPIGVNQQVYQQPAQQESTLNNTNNYNGM